MFNIWVLAAVYDVCMHVLMEQIKPEIEGEYRDCVGRVKTGFFSSVFLIEGHMYHPYTKHVVVTTDPDIPGSVIALVYSTGDTPLMLYNEGDDYEEIYRALYH